VNRDVLFSAAIGYGMLYLASVLVAVVLAGLACAFLAKP
jgi:hypothetical protein